MSRFVSLDSKFFPESVNVGKRNALESLPKVDSIVAQVSISRFISLQAHLALMGSTKESLMLVNSGKEKKNYLILMNQIKNSLGFLQALQKIIGNKCDNDKVISQNQVHAQNVIMLQTIESLEFCLDIFKREGVRDPIKLVEIMSILTMLVETLLENLRKVGAFLEKETGNMTDEDKAINTLVLERIKPKARISDDEIEIMAVGQSEILLHKLLTGLQLTAQNLKANKKLFLEETGKKEKEGMHYADILRIYLGDGGAFVVQTRKVLIGLCNFLYPFLQNSKDIFKSLNEKREQEMNQVSIILEMEKKLFEIITQAIRDVNNKVLFAENSVL